MKRNLWQIRDVEDGTIKKLKRYKKDKGLKKMAHVLADLIKYY